MDITKASVNDLKALAYDSLAHIELHQNNLRVINEEIAKRNSAPEKKETDSKKK